ncbi:MAG: hypothetical protein ABIO60_12740 [Aquaticitalea sp.]
MKKRILGIVLAAIFLFAGGITSHVETAEADCGYQQGQWDHMVIGGNRVPVMICPSAGGSICYIPCPPDK